MNTFLHNVIGVNEVASILNVSHGHVKNLCAEGKIAAKKIGKTWVIDKSRLRSEIKVEEKQPLLAITLSDIDSVPVVQYKGKQIDNKIRVSVDWVTNTENRTDGTYIHIEHVEPDEVRGNTKIIQHNHPIVKATSDITCY